MVSRIASSPHVQSALSELGLENAATPEEIRHAFHRLALECHPDRHPGLPSMAERFKKLSNAYRLLIRHKVNERTSESIPRRRQRYPLLGCDLRLSLNLDFLKAVHGGEIPIRYRRPYVCPMCGGSGENDCPLCSASGLATELVHRKIQLPSGLENGDEIRIQGGGAESDLVLVVSCKPHPRFTRRGLDIFTRETLGPETSLDGYYLNVLTIWGLFFVKIPHRFPSEQSFRLSGLGVRRAENGHVVFGDHFFTVQVSRNYADN